MTDTNFHDAKSGHPMRYLVRRNDKWHRSVFNAASITFWFPAALYENLREPLRALTCALAACLVCFCSVLFAQLSVIVLGCAGYITDSTQDECVECAKKKKSSSINQPNPTQH